MGSLGGLCAGPGALWKRVLLEPQSVLRKLCPGRLRSLSHSSFLSPLGSPLPFLHGILGSGQKVAPRARRGLRRHSRFRTVEPRRALGLPGASVLLFVDRAATGLGFRGGPSCSCALQRGAGALPTPVKLFPGEGGGVSAAQAQRSPRLEAERLRGFVAGKSSWEQRSVWPIAGRCPAPDAHVVLPPQPTRPLPAPPWSFRAQAGRWGRPGAWDLGLHNAEGGTVGVWAGRVLTRNFRSPARI